MGIIRNKKTIIIMSAFIVLLIAVLFMTVFFQVSATPTGDSEEQEQKQSDDIIRLNFEKGDVVKGYDIYDENGNALDISNLPGKNKLIIFTWDKCGDCIVEYDNYKRVFDFYNKEDFTVSFIWIDAIPFELLEELGLPRKNNYTDNGLIRFVNWVPTYFIVNEESELLFKDIEMKMLSDYIGKNYAPNRDALKDFIGDKVILFGLEDCGACRVLYNELLGNKYDISLDDIYYIKDIAGEESAGKASLYDANLIIATSFDVQTFPKFVYINADARIVQERKADDIKR